MNYRWDKDPTWNFSPEICFYGANTNFTLEYTVFYSRVYKYYQGLRTQSFKNMFFLKLGLQRFQCNNSVLIKASWSWPCYNPEQYAAIIKWGFKDLSEDDKLQQFTPSWYCRCPWFNPFISSAAPITFQLPSTLDNLHDKRVLYPVIKVLYALHTLLERIAASKTLQRERG